MSESIRRQVQRILVPLTGMALLGAFGCSTSGKTQPDPEPPPQAAQPTGEFRESQAPVTPPPVHEQVPAELSVVYFDFDRAELRADSRATLRKHAKLLGKGGVARVVIEGHCDERGSEEYNAALGERRGWAVKRYLQDLGVDNVQLEVVSYGELKPLVPGHDESAWRYNRNAQFRVMK